MRNALVLGLLVLIAGSACADTHRLNVGGGEVVVTIEPGRLDVSTAQVLRWVEESAQAVAGYLGRFPVKQVLINISTDGEKGPHNGETHCGEPPLIWITLGMTTTPADLRTDDVMTHEMVHLMLPNADHGQQGWAAEGLATYVEALARLGAGRLDRTGFWQLLTKALSKAGGGAAAQGLDATNAGEQRYWSGALFWMLADLEIREKTQGQKTLGDALRGIQKAGGCVSEHWPIEKTLAAADAAIGVNVLAPLRARMRASAVGADVPQLLARLGVQREGSNLAFDDAAPRAGLRRSLETAGLQFTRR